MDEKTVIRTPVGVVKVSNGLREELEGFQSTLGLNSIAEAARITMYLGVRVLKLMANEEHIKAVSEAASGD